MESPDTEIRNHSIETEIETDGRWIAEAVDIPGVLAYGATEDEAIANVCILVEQVLSEREAAENPTLPSIAYL